MRSVPINLIRIVGLITLLMVSACDYYALDKEEPKYPCKVLGACDATITKYLKKLNSRGIKVITVGQDYMISIPARYLFASESPHMKWNAYPLLNEVVVFMKQFHKIAVNVTSFSNKYVSPQREHALTLARSRVISEYLWSQGIDSRFIFSQGLGSDKPILLDSNDGDNSANSRVEITFRRAVA